MHLKFKKIRWKNLLSTGNAWIEMSLDDKPSTLIFGKNGSGKSTLLDAVSLALFGKPFRNIRKNQLVNSINKKDCVVEIELGIGSKEYKIVRGISPNIFEVWSNGLMLNQNRDSKDYQSYLEKFILGMNQKTFNQIVIAGAAQYTPFMQLSAAERRAFIEDLLDIQIFSTMSTIVKNRVSENKIELEKLKIGIDAKIDKRNMLSNNISDFEKDNNNKIRVIEGEVKDLQDRREHVNILLLAQEKIISNCTTLLIDEPVVLAKLKKMVNMKTKIETNRENFNQKHEFLENHEDCPTCKQKIAEEFKIDEQCRIDKKLIELDKGLEEISKEIKELETKAEEYSIARKGLQGALTAKAKHDMELKQNKYMINKHFEELNNLYANPTVLGNLKVEIVNTQTEIDNLLKQSKEASEQKTILATAADMLKDGGIKTRIVKQYVPVINQTVNKYLRSLGFLAQFELDETFSETIKSRYKDEFSYDNFSEGEKMRIDLALMLTWRSIAKARNSASANLLILDEVFDGSLDDTGIDDFIKIMQNLSTDTNVFVISHKQDQMIDKFSRVYNAEKKRNYSVMTEIK